MGTKKWDFVEEGEANFYFIKSQKNWIARVQLNGEMTVEEQRIIMSSLCDILNWVELDGKFDKTK